MIPALRVRFPGSSQVALLGLERSTDAELCTFAAAGSFVICSKDDAFQQLVAARAYAPKLVRIAMGNVANERVLAALLSSADAIEAALADPATGVVVLR
jgi:predicted nuclease of predicted toxin-antitoxin system